MKRSFLYALLLLFPVFALAQQEWTPEKTDRFVNDYSQILTQEQHDALEQRLVAFNDSTSNQIVVVITPTLYGDEIKAVGQRIGQSWGIGQKDLNNGLLIIIKTKTSEEPDGDVAICTGYGMEGAFPDVFCGKIIDDKMIPSLIEGDYYAAIDKALDVIFPVAVGEYSYEMYKEDNEMSDTIAGIFTFLFFGGIFWLFYRSYKRHKKNGGGGGYSGSSYGGYSSSSHSSSWSSSSSSSSSSSRSFGGGSFGGGGASRKF